MKEFSRWATCIMEAKTEQTMRLFGRLGYYYNGIEIENMCLFIYLFTKFERILIESFLTMLKAC